MIALHIRDSPLHLLQRARAGAWANFRPFGGRPFPSGPFAPDAGVLMKSAPLPFFYLLFTTVPAKSQGDFSFSAKSIPKQ